MRQEGVLVDDRHAGVGVDEDVVVLVEKCFVVAQIVREDLLPPGDRRDLELRFVQKDRPGDHVEQRQAVDGAFDDELVRLRAAPPRGCRRRRW